MSVAKRHSGVIVPMVTPFTADGRIDRAMAERVTNYLVEAGCHPFVLGTTGEGASIQERERAELVSWTVQAAAGRAMVYAGISTNVLEDAADMARHYLELGADAVVAHPPSYYPITGDDMLRYFALLADRAGGPLVIYNIPVTTHLSIPLDVVEELSHHPNVVGLKDSESDLNRLEEAISRWSGRADFAHLTGWAAQSEYGLKLGSDGIVPSAGNVVPRWYRALYDAAITQDYATSHAIQKATDALSTLYVDHPTLGQSLAALKTMMAARGLCEPHMLPPLFRLIPRDEEAVRRRMERFDPEVIPTHAGRA
ncbi:MAG: dihydrodipicolinate synthase family protein [Gemmatimonadetes bacterium]|nr:dihydrodipicolinate synthase family protein [Gemmatimonadota bacterium]